MLASPRRMGIGLGLGLGGAAAPTLLSIAPTLAAEHWSDLGVTVATGVSSWADQSGVSGVPWVMGSAASQPAREATGWIDGGPSILFDGTNDYMTANGLAAYITGNDTPFTVIMLCQMVAVGANKRLWSSHNTSTMEAYLTATAHGVFRYSAGGDYVERTGGTPDTNRHIMSWVFSGTTISLFIDGTVVINGAAMNQNALTTASLSMGTYQTSTIGTYNANMRVAHHSLYSSALSPTDRARVEAYIIARRGV